MVKALYDAAHLDGWGHSVSLLLTNLPDPRKPPADLIVKAKGLDKHYIPARCPNGSESGAPMDYSTDEEAQQAIGYARAILTFCRRHLTPSGT